ncbi:hypothetical protein [Pelagibaculum spongiae]|nr:hypothetical protein [Pelagibaculum spongiae]
MSGRSKVISSAYQFAYAMDNALNLSSLVIEPSNKLRLATANTGA